MLLWCVEKAIKWDECLVNAHECCRDKWLKSYEKDLDEDIKFINKLKEIIKNDQ